MKPSPSGTCRRVTNIVLYFLLSPTIMTLEIAGRKDLRASSTGTGAMFSPPAVMMSSLMRPVMLSKSVFGSMAPTSPLCNHPSSSMLSLVFAMLLR